MKRTYILFALFIFGLSPVWGQVQKSMQEQLWEGFQHSLQQDILEKEKKEKKIQEDRENEQFQKGTEELKSVFANPYAKGIVQSAKNKIEQLRKNVPQTKERKEILSKYSQLISGYESEARKFLALFEGEITNPDYERYRKEISTLIPPQMQTLGRIIKAHYDQNGLDALAFPEEYVYLNAKLVELRSGFKNLDKISDRGKLAARLDAIVKIESEISEEHKTYHALK